MYKPINIYLNQFPYLLLSYVQTKSGLISEVIFPALNNLFKLSADLAPFVGNGTKVKIPYEIKPPLN